MASLALAACGGEDEGDQSSAAPPKQEANVEFPAAEGKTIRALRADLPEGAIFAPAVGTLRVGKNRLSFGLFDTSRAQIVPEAVAVYVAQADGRRLRGPFPARAESLAVKPQFMSQQTQADLEDVKSFFVADVVFPRRGRYIITAVAKADGKMISTSQVALLAGGKNQPPDIGDEAVRTHTDTIEDAGRDLSRIDTRLPPVAEMHENDLYDVIGKEPVVFVVTTPALCQVRICGPVYDVTLQVKNQHPDVVFIQQEPWEDNDPQKGLRPPVAAWRMVTEPWTYLIGRDGKVKERFEGAVSVRELDAAMAKIKS
jgi:hypothetical protein